MSGVAYHAWTHRPKGLGGTDPLQPTPWIVLHDGSTTVADNTVKAMPFLQVTYDPGLVQLGVGPFTLNTITIDATNHWQLRTLVEGWYYYELTTFWDQVSTPGNDVGFAQHRLRMSSSTGIMFTADNDQRASADWNATTYLEGHFEMELNPYLKSEGTLFIPASRNWIVEGVQITGLTRGMSGESLKVWFLGESESDNWTTTSA